MNILIIEDDPQQAKTLVQKLKHHLGPEITIDGPYDEFQKVLPHVQKGNVELALIDIQLHRDLYAGIHIAETIQQFLSVPIVFISGVTDKDIVEKAEKVKRSNFLQKPFDDNSLKRALDWALNFGRSNNTKELKIDFKPRGRDKYWIKTERLTYVGVEPGNILLVEAMDHYCRVHIAGSKPLTTKASLKADILENRLSSYPYFFHLSRSVVVNLNAVERVIGNQLVIERLEKINHRLLTIPRGKREEVFNVLGINC